MARTRKYPSYKYILALLDGLTAVLAIYVTMHVAESVYGSPTAHWSPSIVDLLTSFLLYGSGIIFTFQYLDMYKLNIIVTVVDHSFRILCGLITTLIGVVVVVYFARTVPVVDHPQLLALFGLVSLILFLWVRLLIFRNLYLLLSRQKFLQRNILIVGASENGRNVAVNLFLHDYLGMVVVGFLDDGVTKGTPIFNNARVIGFSKDLAQTVKEYEVDEIILCPEKIDYSALMVMMERATGLNAVVKISSPLYEVIPVRRAIEYYGNVPVAAIFQSGPTRWREALKRVFDVAVASLAVLFLLPVYAVIALLIKMGSRGPVFYSQTRIGKDGKRFKFYKFRSMFVGSDQDAERKDRVLTFMKSKRNFGEWTSTSTKIVSESKVTRIGKWIRRLSLDELPQLFNVLKGDMSLVGPRPCLEYEYENYEEWHKQRTRVLPGCTGIWQVTSRSVVSFDDMVILDLHYIQNESLWLDFRILLKTIPVMLLGTGAK